MRLRRFLPAILGAAVLAAPFGLRAQTENSTGAAATLNPLQVLGQGARPLAMGSAFTAVKGDLMAALFNPAGQAYLHGAQAAFNHHSWLGGINQDSIAAVLSGQTLSVGLYGDLVNYGEIESTDNEGNVVGSFTPTDFSLGLALAKAFHNGLALGGTLRGTQQSIQDSGQLISGGDLGMMWAAEELPVVIGVAYANLGPTVGGKAPTAALRLGFSYDLALSDRSGVLFAAGGSGLNNGASQLQAGLEARLANVFFLRGGYQLNLMDNQTGGLSGLTAGLGARAGSLALDYAYLPYGRIGNSHRVSLSYVFDDGSRAPVKEKKAPVPAAAPRAALPAPAAAPSPVALPDPNAVAPAPPPSAAAPSSAPPAEPGEAVDMVFEVPANEGDLLRQAVEQHPQDAEAWKKLGRYYWGQKDKARMVEAFKKALDLDPGDAVLRDWLGKVAP